MNTPAPEPTPPPAGTSLVGQVVSGRYRIQKLLGEGGMGAVYLAEHTLMRKRVALKLLHAEMSTDEEVLTRFRREAEAAAHVEHANVVAATDFGQTEDGAFFLVLEYVEGTSLREAMNAAGAMSTGRALHVARQIALALERAHASGIVHRDLKPENVMLVRKDDDPDFVKVLDFGIAKLEPHPQRDATQPLTRLGTILGTPEYMAPEQALGEPVGPAADLYAVGVMLYEMLCGKRPFDADDRMAILSMHIVAPVPSIADRTPTIDVPPAIEQLVRSLLEKDAKQRPTGARALLEAIDSVAAQSRIELTPARSTRSIARESSRANDPVAPSPSPLPPAPPKKLSRGALLAIAAGTPLLLVLLVVTIILVARSAMSGASGSGARTDGVDGETAPIRATRASPEELHAATTRGVPALEALAGAVPEDPAVHAQLALALADAGRSADMLRVIEALAALDERAIDDRLLDAVASAARQTDTIDSAFALLEGALGARGVDVLVALSADKSAPIAVQRRAAKSVARAEVRANASPATAVLLDLKAAKRCDDKHELLGRLKESGDARVLSTLKALKSTRGCGFLGARDCHPCMRKDKALDEAIAAVEARSPK